MTIEQEIDALTKQIRELQAELEILIACRDAEEGKGNAKD